MFTGVLLLVGLLLAACSHQQLVKVVRTDGSVVIGTIVAVRPDAVVIGTDGHETVTIPRSLIASMEPFTPEQAEATRRGASPDGGNATGGNATGGNTTGGNANGGNATGGNATGGGQGGQNAGGGQGGEAGSGGQQDRPAEGSGGTSGGSGTAADSAGSGGGSPGGGTIPVTVPNDDTGRSHDASRAGNGGTSGGTGAGAGSGGTGGGTGSGAGPASGNHANKGGTGGSNVEGPGAGAVLPAESTLALALDAPVGSDTNHSEDTITATLKSPLALQGGRTVPAGTRVHGTLVEALSARNGKGRGRLAIRFTALIVNNAPIAIATTTVRFTGSVLSAHDLHKIGVGAAIGGAFGGLLGRTRQALGVATAVGAGAGTAVAMVTRTNDVRLERGAVLRVRLEQSVVVPAS